jgi:peroxiredoxin
MKNNKTINQRRFIKLFTFGVFSILFFLMRSEASAETIGPAGQVGSVFPANDLNKLCQKDLIGAKKNTLKLVVFLPNESDYESMLDSGFSYYFVNQEAFQKSLEDWQLEKVYIKSPHLAASTITKNNTSEVAVNLPSPILRQFLPPPKSYLAGDCELSDKKSADNYVKFIKELKLSFPKTAEGSATVFLLDQNNTIQWRDDDYQSQGEHLKPLEVKIKAMLGQPDPVAVFTTPVKTLRLGDEAPDFIINDSQKLSDLKGKTTLITFYPAAFSGTLSERGGGCMMCCAVQIVSLADSEGISDLSPAIGPAHAKIERLAITSSTPSLLNKWESTLKTAGRMQFVNDLDYGIAQAYSSYDRSKGYNYRTVFIVDKNGRIAFVDWEYRREDSRVVKEAIEAIAKK